MPTFDFLWFISNSQLFQEGVVELLRQVWAHGFVEIRLVAFECHVECKLLWNIKGFFERLTVDR